MALTSTILLDLIGQTQTLTYFQGASQVDQITFSSNSVTFASSAAFNLSKSDCSLYQSLLQTYITALILNFPNSYKSVSSAWPLCNFQTSITSQGVTHINYVQTSLGNSVYSINYVPIAASAGFAIRSQITITLQEFFMMQPILAAYFNQVGLN